MAKRSRSYYTNSRTQKMAKIIGEAKMKLLRIYMGGVIVRIPKKIRPAYHMYMERPEYFDRLGTLTACDLLSCTPRYFKHLQDQWKLINKVFIK